MWTVSPPTGSTCPLLPVCTEISCKRKNVFGFLISLKRGETNNCLQKSVLVWTGLFLTSRWATRWHFGLFFCFFFHFYVPNLHQTKCKPIRRSCHFFHGDTDPSPAVFVSTVHQAYTRAVTCQPSWQVIFLILADSVIHITHDCAKLSPAVRQFILRQEALLKMNVVTP